MNYLGPELHRQNVQLLTLSKYSEWVGREWLYNKGTDEAQFHVRKKLTEEKHEAAEAILSGDSDRIVDEIGDFLWTATANAMNVGITLDECLRHELSRDFFDEDIITLKKVDELALQLIPDESPEIMAAWVDYIGYYLGKAAKQWKNLSPYVTTGIVSESFTDPWIRLKKARTYDGLAQAILISSAITQRMAGKTIADVFLNNVSKLEDRVHRGVPIASRVK